MMTKQEFLDALKDPTAHNMKWLKDQFICKHPDTVHRITAYPSNRLSNGAPPRAYWTVDLVALDKKVLRGLISEFEADINRIIRGSMVYRQNYIQQHGEHILAFSVYL